MSKIKLEHSEDTAKYFEGLARNAKKFELHRRRVRLAPANSNAARSTFAGTIRSIPLRPIYIGNTDHND